MALWRLHLNFKSRNLLGCLVSPPPSFFFSDEESGPQRLSELTELTELISG